MRSLLLALLLTATSTTETTVPTVSCETQGKHFHCVSRGAEAYDVYPYWVLHTTKIRSAYGIEFDADAPVDWTQITVQFIKNPTETSVACVEVIRQAGRAKFRVCTTRPVTEETAY